MKTQTNKDRFRFYTSLAIISAAFIICLGILGMSGGLSFLFSKAWKVVPKFPKFSELKEVNASSAEIDEIINSQPKISFSRSTKYILVEASSMNCLSCASMYGYNQNKTSTYDKIIDEFVSTRKLDYVWIDNASDNGDIKKHTSLYCVAEQSSKEFFEYKKLLYKNYSITFNLDKSKEYVKSFGLDVAKFEECVSSNKYEERVKGFTELLSSQGNTSNPTFYLYKVEEKEVETQDKKIEKRSVFTLIDLNTRTNYDIDIKPFLEKYLNKD